YLLDLILSDLGQQHATIRAVPGEALGVAHAVGVDVRQCVASVHEGVGGGDAIVAVFTVVAQGVDAQDLAEMALQVLAGAQRVAAAAAVADADVKQTKVLVTWPGQGIEADLSAVVVGEGLGGTEYFSRCLAIVAGR